ncbi:MAG: hypothetical protein JNN13_00095, partial [Planctomycetes bacterium]|nr:hypothetical protein [Planctomycetota bacterium]
TLLADLQPGPGSSLITPGGFLGNVGELAGGKLVFMADDGAHGREPWVLPVPGSRQVLQRYSTRRFEVGDPVLGSSVAMGARYLAPGDLGTITIGLPTAGFLPIAKHRCVHVDPQRSFLAAMVVASPTGEWNGAVVLPNQPSLIGLDLVIQALFVDGSLPLGFDAGDAHWLSLGS